MKHPHHALDAVLDGLERALHRLGPERAAGLLVLSDAHDRRLRGSNLAVPRRVKDFIEISEYTSLDDLIRFLDGAELTVDIRGVDLRNLRVDLLVANSRSGGQVRPVMGNNQGTGGTGSSGTGFGGTQNRTGNTQLPGDVPIAGASSRGTTNR